MNADKAAGLVSWLQVVVALITVGKTTVEEIVEIVKSLRGATPEGLDTIEEQDAFLVTLRAEIAEALADAQREATR